jgi:hypothetical protein
MIIYSEAIQRNDGWWFKRTVDSYEVWFGPYPDSENCWYNLQMTREYDVYMTNQVQQNLFDNTTWRGQVRDIFGNNSTEAYPPRGSRG